MTGAFDPQFAGDAPFRPEGSRDPARAAACADAPAEAAMIGALFADETLLDRVSDTISGEEFSDRLFGEVFEAIADMLAAGETASPITVARRLRENDELGKRGGARYLTDLQHSDHAKRGPGHAGHIRDLARRRRLQNDLGRIRADAGNTTKPIVALVGDLDFAATIALDGSVAAPKPVTVAEAWDRTMASVDAIAAGTAPRGVQVAGFREWNEITNGMHPGQMILLGGRPGMGKTAVAGKVATGAAEAGHGVLFISLEMPVDQLMLRIIADRIFRHGGRATFEDVQKGRLDERDRMLVARARDEIDAMPLIFEEPHGLNAARIPSLIRKTQRALAGRGKTLDLVVLDYLGLLSAPQKRDGLTAEVTDISRLVKLAARSCGVPILALAQLNRQVEQRDDKHPMLSDLRDSGSLEQDADTVVFAYRAEYYLKQLHYDAGHKKYEAWQQDLLAERDRLEVYSAKVRQGSTERRRCYFFGGRQAIRSSDYYVNGGAWS